MFKENYIHHLIQGKCKLNLRYTGDIFLMWKGTLDKLNKFTAKINQFHPSIKFHFNYSSNSVNFLDTAVQKSSSVELLTTLFKKETDCLAYLHRKSEHLESLNCSISYAQTLRLKQIYTILNLIVTFWGKNLSIEDIKRLKYMTAYQKHLTETGNTY